MASARELVRLAARGPVLVHGASAPWLAYATAKLAATADGAAAGGASRPVIVVTADDAIAARLSDDIAFFAPGGVTLPAPDSSPYAELAADRVIAAARLGVLYRLAAGDAPPIIVTSIAAILRRTLDREELLARALTITPGQTVDREAVAAKLVAAGFARVPVVEDAGTFAVRGAVIDVATPLQPYPVRIELDGDVVDSLRLFDPGTQRTLRTIDRVDLHPVRDTIVTGDVDWKTALREAADAVHHPSRATRQLIEQVAAGDFVGIDVLMPAFHARTAAVWDLVPAATQWVWWDPDAILACADAELANAAARHADRIAHRQVSFPPEAHFVERAALIERLTHDPRRIVLPTLELAADPRGEGAAPLRVVLDDLRALRADLERMRVQHDDHLAKPLVQAVNGWRADGLTVTFAADSAQRRDRIAGLMEQYGLEAEITIAPFTASFVSRADGIALVSTTDVLGARKAGPRRSASKKAKDALLGGVGDFSQLVAGDFLVHQLHGVGRYRGLVKLPGTGPIDFLHLEYDGGMLYLPVYRLGEVQRYVGAEGHAPRIDKLGGVTWEKARSKVSRHVAALAEELLQVYAQRAALPGHRFPAADDFYREFEAAFPFEETPDQAAAIDAVEGDMESAKSMDRLVCGDVGYGKTEVALRAIFKAALAGKQAVLLAPTTLLVEQHARTMTERFASWPVKVGKLSRFQSRNEQLATVRALAEGQLDVVVGTHRVLSPDVRWKDLGLVVIDEEQRFGVTHKERLKKLRTQVDVLTLTATPIPRTLHLAMAGLRDLSIIATPPADRRSVRTFVATVDEALIKSALEQELARGGQVYFVTRTIGEERKKGAPTSMSEASIYDWAELVRRLVPKARVGVAHGALPAEKLEDVMVQFVKGELDVLVATTIVESGLDIPRANTMFVARADTFGLSQLYQLRGRVGRSRERAYCYLLVPAPDQLTEEARRRLEALQRFTELGAGFQIASADLEIRGGGELLGARQSGSIASVGFDQYTRMLEAAVAELRGQPIHQLVDPELTIEVPGFIPDDYVPDTGQRLELYKRLSSIEDEDEVREVLDEIQDRYGPLPGEVLLLADLMVVKALARRIDAISVELTRSRLAIGLAASTPIDVTKVPGPWKLERDGRLHVPIGATETAPAEAARRRLQSLIERAT
jgi:transcription-repair coupling factor (superfamily II helicase)